MITVVGKQPHRKSFTIMYNIPDDSVHTAHAGQVHMVLSPCDCEACCFAVAKHLAGK
jgi:hypothetical protein